MMKNNLYALVPMAGTLLSAPLQAQVLEYIDCEVRDPAAFVAASEQFMNAMSGGVRPSVSLDVNLWNGSSPATHTIVVAYNDYAELEAFFKRIADTPEAYQQLIQSINESGECIDEGLAVQLGAWGDLESAWEYYAVYPVVATDGGRYNQAFEAYAASIVDDAPGPILYYQNRAGREEVTHFVVFLSPSLASLNTFLDTLTQSEAYAEFVREVADIRTLGTASQAQRIMTWEP